MSTVIIRVINEHAAATSCISNGAFIAMCCIPTFIDVTGLLVKASLPQGWHPQLGKKKTQRDQMHEVFVF